MASTGARWGGRFKGSLLLEPAEVGAVTFFKLIRIDTSETEDSTADCRKWPPFPRQRSVWQVVRLINGERNGRRKTLLYKPSCSRYIRPVGHSRGTSSPFFAASRRRRVLFEVGGESRVHRAIEGTMTRDVKGYIIFFSDDEILKFIKPRSANRCPCN